MTDSYAKKIQWEIEKMDPGSVFVRSDFAEIADSETLRRNLNRLAENGTLYRVQKGVYEKPKFNARLGEKVATDPQKVAKALARGYHWTIVPSGEAALNQLGLSTQVPAVWCYISDGPYRSYSWDRTKLEFRHRTNREISGMSEKSALVVQALKAIGKENITPEILQKIRKKLTPEETRKLLEETKGCTEWVYKAIRQIGRGEER